MKDERYFKPERNFKKHLNWILPILITALILTIVSLISANISMDKLVTIRVILRYLAGGISFLGVGVILYSFSGIFTKKKIIRYIATVLLVVVSIFMYNEWKTPKVVKMKEDVIYIKPMSSINSEE